MEHSPNKPKYNRPEALPDNFLGIEGKEASLEYSRFVILPVPYEATTSYRTGTGDGPQAIIRASHQLEDYDDELDCEPYLQGIHTLPDLLAARENPETMVSQTTAQCSLLINQEKIVVTLGGEHTITLGAVRAYKDKFPGLTVLQLDAHADLRDKYEGTRYSHASVMRRITEFCPIVPVGIRSLSLEERDYLNCQSITPFFYGGPHSIDPNSVVDALKLTGDKVYITIDLDVLDPSIMAAVGNPEPGGMAWHESLTFLKSICQNTEVVGFDVMELSPSEGPIACTYLAARLIYKIIGYLGIPKQ